MASLRERLDKVLVERGLATSRERAQRRIMAGEVIVDGHRLDKPGTAIALDAEITLRGEENPYVSRGGLKLASALDHWQIDVAGLQAADIGASTGGFTDCLLQKGAIRSLAVDVGYGQFAWPLRQDERVELIERTNFRTMDVGPWRSTCDIVTIDVSFISLVHILSNAVELLRVGGLLLPLVKPQFEVGKANLGKGGVVRDPAVRAMAVDKIREAALDRGLIFLGSFECPVPGPKGNREYFLHLRTAS